MKAKSLKKGPLQPLFPLNYIISSHPNKIKNHLPYGEIKITFGSV
jgi:hypothetical protein